MQKINDDEIQAVAAEIKQKERLALVKPNTVVEWTVGEVRYDDLGNAERFLDLAGEDLLYSAEAKQWLYWNKTHWEFDSTEFVFELATAFAKSLYAPDLCIQEAGMKHAKRSNMRSGINAMLELAQRKRTVTMSEFDAQPYLLNCRNGTLDLKTRELRKHDRNDRITRIVNSDYEPDAESQAYTSFLETVQPDPSIRAFLQRSIGYSLLGVVRERSFWILYGTGNNGKSIFTNLFNNLLGEYASATTTSSVMAKKQNAIPNDIARLRGKRFIIIPETEENERLNSALVKALSAGDKVTARFLFGEFFDFYFSGKLWIATNHKPNITDHSKGFWDRLKLVPFTQDIPADKVIKSDDLMQQLLAEAPGVLNWAVKGCDDYLDLDGLDVPDVIAAEIERYKFEQDSIAQFMELRFETMAAFIEENGDEYDVTDKFKADNTEVYKAYRSYCSETGEFDYGQRRLTQKLKDRGFSQMPVKGRRVWSGFRLKEV